jgi:glycosyltransferase involved in cell wall biosynthesis
VVTSDGVTPARVGAAPAAAERGLRVGERVEPVHEVADRVEDVVEFVGLGRDLVDAREALLRAVERGAARLPLVGELVDPPARHPRPHVRDRLAKRRRPDRDRCGLDATDGEDAEQHAATTLEQVATVEERPPGRLELSREGGTAREETEWAHRASLQAASGRPRGCARVTPTVGATMRILVSTLTPYPSGKAHAVHITGTAQGLADAGHRVALVTAQDGPGWPKGGGTPDTSAFTIRALAHRDHRGQSIVNGVRLTRLARSARPEAAFADDVRSGLALALAGVPVVVELHSMQFHASRLGRRALHALMERPELRGIVTISAALRDDLVVATGVDAGLVTVLPEAARRRSDEELEAAPPAWLRGSMREGVLQVGYSGSLYEGRGVGLMMELAERLPQVDVHVLGGPEADADRLRARPDRPENLQVHGLRTIGDAERFQTSMDVLLAPYARSVITPGGVDTSRWMSPMKVFEYLAAGRAMVCSDLPVLREVLEHERVALLADPEDPSAWVEAVERLQDDVELRRRLGEQGRALHAERFTWEARTRGLVAIWRAEADR